MLTPLWFIKISSLKATTAILLILLLKSNLLRLKGGIIGGFVALTLLSGLIVSSSIALGSLVYIYKFMKDQDKSENYDIDSDLKTVDIWLLILL